MEELLGNGDGFGVSSMAELEELKKALDIGYSQPTTGTGADALRVESLEATLKLLTYSQEHLRLWNQIPKLDAFSTVEEYNRLVNYGSDGGGFTSSGVLPEEDDTTWERADQKVKFLGTTRSVTHPATLNRTIPADLVAAETQNGALWLMGKLNHALYFGDSDAIPVEFNSLSKQIEDGAGHVIDLAGQPLTKDDVENAADLVSQNFGVMTSMFTNGKAYADLSNTYGAQQRWQGNPTPGMVGTPLNGVYTTNGPVTFQPDTFVKTGQSAPAAATSPKAPNPPTIAPGSPGSSASSLFVATDAGDYVYQVTAVNKYGESQPSALSSAVTLAAGEAVDIVITDGGGSNEATAYKVYRSIKDGSSATYIGEITARASVSGVYQPTTTFTDINSWRPQCYRGLGLDLSQQSLSFKQLSPMVKMNLAIVSPAIRWMQLLYGTPIVYAPKKNVLFKNIGTANS